MKNLLIYLFISVLFISCQAQDNSFEGDGKVDFIAVSKVPVVEGTINGKKAFYIVDSGASLSVLDDNQSEYFDFSTSKSNMAAAGYGGVASFGNAYDVKLTIGGKKFDTDFKSQDLSKIIDLIRENDGVEISGIIGSDIMKDYHFIIDYSELTISISK